MGSSGFVALDWDANDPEHAFVSFIEIAEALWGRRYGREVLKAVIRWATERGARRLTAEIPADNDRSKRLFERVGFRRAPAAARPGAHERWGCFRPHG